MNTPNATADDLKRACEVLRDTAATIGLRDVDDSFWKAITVQERALIGVAMGWPTLYKARFVHPGEALVRLHKESCRPETFVAECVFDQSAVSGQEEPK